MSAHILDSRLHPLPVVKVENLTVYRGNYAAVRDVSFELRPGTSVAIVGPNGSGKSTLVQAMLDLMPCATGRVEIWGLPLARLGKRRQQIGYIPQNFIFDRTFPLSVSELVGLGWIASRTKPTSPLSALLPEALRPAPEKSEAIVQALHRVQAYHLRRQAIGTLSGGELKRVLLAYCLVMPRQFLVLDEAFAGVDVQGEAEFYSLLDDLKRQEGWTVLQISHDLDMVSRYCDQILCLNQTLICSGRPELALSAENLLATYGPGFSRYRHQH